MNLGSGIFRPLYLLCSPNILEQAPTIFSVLRILICRLIKSANIDHRVCLVIIYKISLQRFAVFVKGISHIFQKNLQKAADQAFDRRFLCYFSKTGCICCSLSARSTLIGSLSKSATSELGFLSTSSWQSGTK